jgi:hypothetical protein
LSVDIWQWLQDAFPANETPGLPGNAALFDTTSAIIKTGLNIAQDTNDPQRYTVAGDSVAIASSVGRPVWTWCSACCRVLATTSRSATGTTGRCAGSRPARRP